MSITPESIVNIDPMISPLALIATGMPRSPGPHTARTILKCAIHGLKNTALLSFFSNTKSLIVRREENKQEKHDVGSPSLETMVL